MHASAFRRTSFDHITCASGANPSAPALPRRRALRASACIAGRTAGSALAMLDEQEVACVHDHSRLAAGRPRRGSCPRCTDPAPGSAAGAAPREVIEPVEQRQHQRRRRGDPFQRVVADLRPSSRRSARPPAPATVRPRVGGRRSRRASRCARAAPLGDQRRGRLARDHHNLSAGPIERASDQPAHAPRAKDGDLHCVWIDQDHARASMPSTRAVRLHRSLGVSCRLAFCRVSDPAQSSHAPHRRSTAISTRDPRPRTVGAGAGHGALAQEHFERPRQRRPRRLTRRSGSCRTGARPATTAWRRAWSTTARTTGNLASSCSRCAGRCGWSTATPLQSVAALCVTRSADGRWLAGRRAPWVSSWAGRWALGAGGAVDLGENPADTLVRELREEWAVSPERVRGEALLRLPHRLVMFVGQAWLAEGVERAGDARPRARRVGLVADARSTSGPRRPARRCRAMARWLIAVTRVPAPRRPPDR